MTEGMVRPPSSEELTRLAAVVEGVRRASREARLLPLAETAAEFDPDDPERLANLLFAPLANEAAEHVEDPGATPAESSVPGADFRPADVALVAAAGRSFLYSETFMTRQYAETMARIESGDHLLVIAAAARYDSETYPRPTPVSVFTNEPYNMTPDQVEAVVERFGSDPAFADLKTAKASNGALYLYSTTHLVPDLAEALAQWDAVGQFDSP